TLVVSGQILSVGEGDPRTRFSKAYQELIRSAFTSLRMIHGAFSEATVAQVMEDQDDLLDGLAVQLSEAEQEVLVDVERQQKLGERLSAEDLVRKYEARPYGWPNWATLTFVARLYRLGKLELREKELLSSVEVIEALTNSRRLGGVSVRKQEQFDASAIQALKRFHQELFGVASSGTDARSSSEALRMAMADEAQELRELSAQTSTYPFLAELKPWAEQAEVLSKKGDDFLLNQLSTYKDDWLAANEDLLTPLKQFFKGHQKTVYDQVKAFEARYGEEFADLPAEQVQPLQSLLANHRPFAGGLIPQANNTMTALQGLLAQRLQQVQTEALAQIKAQEQRFQATDDFQKLEQEQQEQVLAETTRAIADVQAASQPGRVLLRVNRYRGEEVPRQLQRLAMLAAPHDINPVPPITVVAASALKANCPLSQITNEAELQQWLEALRTAARRELEQGHRISL
ncbi:MAG: hypothetical protein WCH37_06370, partial [Synechococcaceae cyanobacterium ELA182]